jgi:hypothetical protein
MWSRMRSVRCLSKILSRLGLQVPRVFCEVHAFIVEQNDHAAVLLMKTGSVSSQTFMNLYQLFYRIFYRIVVEPQRKRYRFLITPQPIVAMLYRRYV